LPRRYSKTSGGMPALREMQSPLQPEGLAALSPGQRPGYAIPMTQPERLGARAQSQTYRSSHSMPCFRSSSRSSS
jgi:hypothetical protein